MWERWNSYTRDKGFGDVEMNSFNHYAYGAIGEWMYERVAGLAPDPAAPGYKHFFVRPLFASQLDSASAELETPYGKAASAWVKWTAKSNWKLLSRQTRRPLLIFLTVASRRLSEPGLTILK
jgi:alpha-L-rhamnosidase